ncbi:uncharacterized protein LOC127791323 [Diospyros lotus]|uniref:uncharacterized protein LOC127791323 n=1 Tax=Diospyros lotus TaxID=55363 RepID=UPI00225B8728|nr:uncharacterized protein LOC127791323 [Diospyros lotus]
MSQAVSTFFSPNPPSKPTCFASSHTCLCSPSRVQIIPFNSSPIRAQPFRRGISHKLLHFSANYPGFLLGRRLGFVVSAENGEGESESESESGVDKAEEEARGQSTMPERFRHLTKEAPDRPVRWPWFIALAFLLYAWRTVLWELSNWKKVVANLTQFMGYLLKLALALIFNFIGDPITSLIRAIETTLYTIRAFYSAVVAYTPVPELTFIIILVSAVLSIAEAAVPDSVDSQPYLLTVSGVIGFAAVRGFVSELSFWMLLFGMFGFSRFIKKRGYVSSVLPVAAVLAAVGEPWVRFVAITSYLALAITHHSRKPSEDKDEAEATVIRRKVPVPLLCAALAIGVRLAAKWAGYRHLTWMIA